MPPSRAIARALPVLALLVALTGCTGDEPAALTVDDFAAGTCRTAAPDVLEVRAIAGRLGEGPEVGDADKVALREAQDRLRTTLESADGPEQDALQALVESVGFLRIRADGNTYEPALAESVERAHDDVVAQCVDGTS